MKKLISLLLSLVMLLSFASCNNISQEDYNDLQKQLDEQKALAASQQEEILSLKGELASLTTDINTKDADIEGKTEQIDKLTSKNEKLQSFYNEWEEYVGRKPLTVMDLGGSYLQRKENLPKYEEGSITLTERGKEHEVSKTSEDVFCFDRQYRLCYYQCNLPLKAALKIVRGIDENTHLKWSQYTPVCYTGNGDFPYNYGEPIIHNYIAEILTYSITRSEMEQIVDILSDLDHEVYENISYRDEIDFNNEIYELPNVDILYTFDANIINEYYRRA